MPELRSTIPCVGAQQERVPSAIEAFPRHDGATARTIPQAAIDPSARDPSSAASGLKGWRPQAIHAVKPKVDARPNEECPTCRPLLT
jgi:hypothetical protein